MGNKSNAKTPTGQPVSSGTGIGAQTGYEVGPDGKAVLTGRQDVDPLGLEGGWRYLFDPLNLAPTVGSATGLTGSDGRLGSEGSKKNKPPPEMPDFKALAEAQTRADRPDINTPFSSQKWTQGPDGEWHLQTALSPEVQARFDAMGEMDWSQLGELGTGDDARNQAVKAHYDDAASRLNPQFQNKHSELMTQLANRGIDPYSPQGQAALAELERSRMYAFSDAERQAQMGGREAGESVFKQNLLSRQQRLSEALKKRSLPMEELLALKGFMDVPGFHRGADQLGAGQMQAQNAMNLWTTQQANQADQTSGYLNLLALLFA